MATLDETNIFGLPLKRQYGLEPEQKAPISEAEQASRQEYEQLIGSDNRLGLTFEGFLKAKERKKVSDQRKAVTQPKPMKALPNYRCLQISSLRT